MATEIELKENWMLRREAGEGWHEQDMDPQLLKLIVAREVAIDRVVEAHASLGSNEDEAFRYLASRVEIYKQQHEISDPPPLPRDEL